MTKLRKKFMPGRGYTKEDWDTVSEDMDATDEEVAQFRPFAEVFPELAESIRRARGPQKAPTKMALSIRLSRDVVEKFKAGGPGWQSRMDKALRKAAGL